MKTSLIMMEVFRNKEGRFIMSEKNLEKTALSEAEINKADIAKPAENEFLLPVKFNKQVLNLDLEKAQELAQKGMKFDLIAKDYEALKNLAKADNLSVGEYILALKRQKSTDRQNEILGKCGEDTEFAQYVMELEKGKTDELLGFKELNENFPQIKSLEDLPECVIEAAKMKGTLVLDEYLRYLHNQDTLMKKSIKNQREARDCAMGPMQNKKGAENPAIAEFLKGLWRK